LPKPPYPEDFSVLKITRDKRIPAEAVPFDGRAEVGGHWREEWSEHRKSMWNCPAGWFYTCNASAPLDKIVEVNGFWEIADLTREEDVLMGLALERKGWHFRFLNAPEATVYHACHGDAEELRRRYKKVTFEQLGWKTKTVKDREVAGMVGPGKSGLDTKPDEVQVVTRDIFNTAYPGSWALISHFKNTPNLKFNEEIGFDLRTERMTA
jgi:hypothetical protein